MRLANIHGQTPLHGAVYRGLEPAISLLVDHDAPLDSADGVGRTPIKLAEEGFFQLASRLRRDGAAALLAELGNDTPEQAPPATAESHPALEKFARSGRCPGGAGGRLEGCVIGVVEG